MRPELLIWTSKSCDHLNSGERFVIVISLVHQSQYPHGRLPPYIVARPCGISTRKKMRDRKRPNRLRRRQLMFRRVTGVIGAALILITSTYVRTQETTPTPPADTQKTDTQEKKEERSTGLPEKGK